MRLCARLEADPADHRTLAAWGSEVGAGERTLSRLFRAELGMTFPQWRTQLRLHHALILLAEHLPVTTVAHRCGWASASAFIDAFRITFGHTPGRPPPNSGPARRTRHVRLDQAAKSENCGTRRAVARAGHRVPPPAKCGRRRRVSSGPDGVMTVEM